VNVYNESLWLNLNFAIIIVGNVNLVVFLTVRYVTLINNA